MTTKRVAILGSTGSIGRSALGLISLYPERFQVVALAAFDRHDLMRDQALQYRPKVVALYSREAARKLRRELPSMEIVEGIKGVAEAAAHPEVDIVIAGIAGAAGLLPTYQAILQGKDIALANKETLVMAGELIMPLVQSRGIHLLPVDSEHSALHQCLRGSHPGEIRRLLLTASGGPFFRSSDPDLQRVTVEEALKHPTWQMGPKITVDSATLMNKGLEVIEARHLFGIDAEQISVIIHPQSVVHSMVEFVDGNVLAQMSITDMRAALLYALSYPERWHSRLPQLDLLSLGDLNFFPPDQDRFPCLRLAYESLRSGRTYPCALNAANEVAVNSFLEGRITFADIPAIVQEVIDSHQAQPAGDLESILEADREARASARRVIGSLAARH